MHEAVAYARRGLSDGVIYVGGYPHFPIRAPAPAAESPSEPQPVPSTRVVEAFHHSQDTPFTHQNGRSLTVLRLSALYGKGAASAHSHLGTPGRRSPEDPLLQHSSNPTLADVFKELIVT